MLFVRIFRMATDESPDATEENPAAAPATPKNNHRPGSLLLDMDAAERWLEQLTEYYEQPSRSDAKKARHE